MVSYVSIFFNTSCNHFCKFLLTRWTGEKQSTVKTSERRRPENYRCHSEDNEEEGKSSTGSTWGDPILKSTHLFCPTWLFRPHLLRRQNDYSQESLPRLCRFWNSTLVDNTNISSLFLMCFNRRRFTRCPLTLLFFHFLIVNCQKYSRKFSNTEVTENKTPLTLPWPSSYRNRFRYPRFHR